MTNHLKKFPFTSILVCIVLSACGGNYGMLPNLPGKNTTNLSSDTALVSEAKLIAERAPASQMPYKLTAVGFSTVSIQPAKSINQKRLLAMRAAKLDAYRTLAEQVYGLRVKGQTTIGEAVVTSDQLASAVEGMITGAEVVSIKATSADTYQVELSLSENHLKRMINAYRKGIFY